MATIHLYSTIKSYEKSTFAFIKGINDELGIEIEMINTYDNFAFDFVYYLTMLSDIAKWAAPHIAAGNSIVMHTDSKDLISFIKEMNGSYEMDDIIEAATRYECQDFISIITSIFFVIPFNYEFDKVFSFVYEDVIENNLPDNDSIVINVNKSVIKNPEYVNTYKSMLIRMEFETMTKQEIANCEYSDCDNCDDSSCPVSHYAYIISEIDKGRELSDILEDIEESQDN